MHVFHLNASSNFFLDSGQICKLNVDFYCFSIFSYLKLLLIKLTISEKGGQFLEIAKN